MLSISTSEIKNGMIAAKDVISKSNLILLSKGSELNERYITWFYETGVYNVCIEGRKELKGLSKELEDLDERFKHMDKNNTEMNIIKKCVKEHIESLYDEYIVEEQEKKEEYGC